MDVIISSSPRRFGRGGRARLAKQAANHQAVVVGRRICIPRIRSMVRVWVRS